MAYNCLAYLWPLGLVSGHHACFETPVVPGIRTRLEGIGTSLREKLLQAGPTMSVQVRTSRLHFRLSCTNIAKDDILAMTAIL